VLSSVLLHVIEPARPVDLAAHRGADGKWRRQDVKHLVVSVDRVDDVNRGPEGSAPLHSRTQQPPGVKRLATRRRVKRGAIEQRRRPAFMVESPRHDSLETPAVRVGVVNPGSHAASTDAAGRSK
jgi:hypothetical protein